MSSKDFWNEGDRLYAIYRKTLDSGIHPGVYEKWIDVHNWTMQTAIDNNLTVMQILNVLKNKYDRDNDG